MSKSEILVGKWRPDWDRWQKVEPLRPVIAIFYQMMNSELTVTFEASSFTIEGRGEEKSQTFTYVVRDESDSELTLDVHRENRGAGVYVIEIADENHIVMRLTEPKKDIMALKRG